MASHKAKQAAATLIRKHSKYLDTADIEGLLSAIGAYGSTVVTSAAGELLREIIPNIFMYMRSIPDNAFQFTKDYNITIPSNIDAIGRAGFSFSDLYKVKIENPNISIGNEAFAFCRNLEEIQVKGASFIRDNAFENCYNLKILPNMNGASRIGKSAFKGCRGLTTIFISPGVMVIDENCFEGCVNATSLILPDTITTLESKCFATCVSLETIHYSGTKYQWGQIQKHNQWRYACPQQTVRCKDGDIILKSRA